MGLLFQVCCRWVINDVHNKPHNSGPGVLHYTCTEAKAFMSMVARLDCSNIVGLRFGNGHVTEKHCLTRMWFLLLLLLPLCVFFKLWIEGSKEDKSWIRSGRNSEVLSIFRLPAWEKSNFWREWRIWVDWCFEIVGDHKLIDHNHYN